MKSLFATIYTTLALCSLSAQASGEGALFQEKTTLGKEISTLGAEIARESALETKHKLNAEQILKLQEKRNHYANQQKHFDELEQKVIDAQNPIDPVTPPLAALRSGEKSTPCDAHFGARPDQNPPLSEIPTTTQGDFGVCYAITASEMLMAQTDKPISYTDVALQNAKNFKGASASTLKKRAVKTKQDPNDPRPQQRNISKLEGGNICTAALAEAYIGPCPKSEAWLERQIGQEENPALEQNAASVTKELAGVYEDLNNALISSKRDAFRAHGKNLLEQYLNAERGLNESSMYRHLTGKSSASRDGGAELKVEFMEFYANHYLPLLERIRQNTGSSPESTPEFSELASILKMSMNLSVISREKLLEQIREDLKKTSNDDLDHALATLELMKSLKPWFGEKAPCGMACFSEIRKITRSLGELNEAIAHSVIEDVFSEEDPWNFLAKTTTGKCSDSSARLSEMSSLRCSESDYLTGFYGMKDGKVFAIHEEKKKELVRTEVSKLLKDGTPVGVSFCSGIKNPNRKDDVLRPFAPGCAPHAALIVGSRYQNGKCEYLVQDSDGDDACGSDGCEGRKKGTRWWDESVISKNIISLSHISKDSK